MNFSPSNPYINSANQYTGQFKVSYKVQTRLIRKPNEDEHYCQAIWKYEREFGIRYRDYTCFISADDKHKIPISKGIAVSTGIQNWKSLIHQEILLSVEDHDFTKLSLTPSVIFFINIPKTISESFYDRSVYVSYKDTIFQPSSALRHSTEFFQVIQSNYLNQSISPILCLYTDSGPDHQYTFGSVQISLVTLFLAGDFDMLMAVRTAPHHS